MNIIIRPPCENDAEAINEIRRQKGVIENILSLGSERITQTNSFLSGAGPETHLYVAEVENKAVAMAGLSVDTRPRKRHVGTIGIMVSNKFQGIGIGTMLMKEILDLADKWLMLPRLELQVYADNERAIAMYESLGFVREGVKKYASIKEGRYEDEVIMARYGPIIQKGSMGNER